MRTPHLPLRNLPMKRFLLLAVVTSCLMMVPPVTRAADAERETQLRFPENVSKSNPYVEIDPDPDYRHASQAAYDAFRQIKYGVRIHWGLYSMLPAARESWSFLPLSNADRQAYVDSYQKWDAGGFDAEQWMQFFDRAGFKCFTITTKHHEGFSLWDTQT